MFCAFSIGYALYSINSNEIERTYNAELNTKTYDCKRWQLTGIPCHHVTTCCKNDRLT